MIGFLISILLAAYGGLEVWMRPAGGWASAPESPLCRYWLCSLDSAVEREFQQHLQSGAAELPHSQSAFEQMLERDPASSYRWCDLADVLLEAGQIAPAKYAMQNAVARGPRSAPILLRAMNFSFQIEDRQAALNLSSKLLDMVSEYDEIIFSTYDRLEIPQDVVLAEGLPKSRRAAQAYIRHLLSPGRFKQAEAAWRWASQLGFVDDDLAASYIPYLLSQKQYETALADWSALLGKRRGPYPDTNALFNGGFEQSLAPVPLAWNIQPVEGTVAERTEDDKHSGNFALRVQFAGTHNVLFNGLYQQAVVRPGRYRLTGWLRTQQITTDQGICLRVIDPVTSSGLDARTEPLSGTEEWKQVEVGFTVASATHLVQVILFRDQSRKFDNKISGTVWLDDVELRRE